MFVMALDIIKLNGRKKEEFKIGYHAEPSLLQLHLHVISMDFHSPTLKTERHWNSFNTKLFIPHRGKTMPYSHKYFEFKTKSLLFFLLLQISNRIDATNLCRRNGIDDGSTIGNHTPTDTIEMSSMSRQTRYNSRFEISSDDSLEMALKPQPNQITVRRRIF